MVNTGHPSRACKLCRARRIKCDETKPHCIKCRKGKRQCPGYRDPFEINLRDETQSTIRKAKAVAAAQKRTDRRDDSKEALLNGSPTKAGDPSPSAGRRQGNQSSSQGSEGSWETNSTWSSPSSDVATLNKPSQSPVGTFPSAALDFNVPNTTPELSFDFNGAWSLPVTNLSSPIKRVAKTISSSFDGTRLGCIADLGGFGDSSRASSAPVLSGLQTPLDEQATCYFLSNFVLSLSAGQNPCLFNFILKILEWGSIKNTPFPMAFTAVSLAALAGRPNSRHLLPKSRIYYSTALIQLKEAIKDKERAKHDTSLASAILLSFYEVSPTRCRWETPKLG